MRNYGIEMAALEGRVVLQGHADYCDAHGHATSTDIALDGTKTESEFCPRCGERKEKTTYALSELTESQAMDMGITEAAVRQAESHAEAVGAIGFTREVPGYYTVVVDGVTRPIVIVRDGRKWLVQYADFTDRNATLEMQTFPLNDLRSARYKAELVWRAMNAARAYAYHCAMGIKSIERLTPGDRVHASMTGKDVREVAVAYSTDRADTFRVDYTDGSYTFGRRGDFLILE